MILVLLSAASAVMAVALNWIDVARVDGASPTGGSSFSPADLKRYSWASSSTPPHGFNTLWIPLAVAAVFATLATTGIGIALFKPSREFQPSRDREAVSGAAVCAFLTAFAFWWLLGQLSYAESKWTKTWNYTAFHAAAGSSLAGILGAIMFGVGITLVIFGVRDKRRQLRIVDRDRSQSTPRKH